MGTRNRTFGKEVCRAIRMRRAHAGTSCLRTRRGQAMLELAVFGAVALAALGFLLRVGLQMYYGWQLRVATFEKARAVACADNANGQNDQGFLDALGTAYHEIRDRQMPDPTDSYMTLQRTRTEASAFVECGDRLTFAFELHPGDERHGYDTLGYRTQELIGVNSNGTEQWFRQDQFPDDWLAGAPDHPTQLLATRGMVVSSTTTNASSGRVIQTDTSSDLSSATGTTSETKVNTIGQPTMTSGLGGGAGSVVWPNNYGGSSNDPP